MGQADDKGEELESHLLAPTSTGDKPLPFGADARRLSTAKQTLADRLLTRLLNVVVVDQILLGAFKFVIFQCTGAHETGSFGAA